MFRRPFCCLAVIVLAMCVALVQPARSAEPVNLAAKGTASSEDGLEADGDGSGPEAAIDGDPETYWDEVNGQALYRLRVELPEATDVGAVRILGYQQHSYAPRDFGILCDGKVVKTVEGATYNDNWLIVALPTTNCRSVELKITGYYGASPAVRELEIFSTAKGLPMPVTESLDPKGPGFQWQRTDQSLALFHDGQIVWRSNHRKGLGKPCLHPVAAVDGMPLTWFRPADHTWHRGVWSTWKFINGLNYWEEGADGLSPGRTEVLQVKAAARDDLSASIELDLCFHPADEAPVMIEQRTIDFSAPDETGSYRIDWQSTFIALEDLKLERTPLPGEPGGAGHGGYAGFSVRMAAETRGWNVRTSEDLADQEAHGKTARWLDAAGETTAGTPAGLAIFDHPKNLRHPAPWYVAKNMPYYSPAIIFKEPYTLPAGESLTLRYRVLVYTGQRDKEALNKEWQDWK